MDHKALTFNNRFITGSSCDQCAGLLHQPALSICLDREAASRRFWRRLSSAKALMKDSPIATAGLPHRFASKDDVGLIAFINAMHLSVKAKVVAEQHRGLSLSEIVVQVREMVRLAEEDPHQPKRFPARTFRAISRQAVAWCIEAYQPLVLTGGNDFFSRPKAADPVLVSHALGRDQTTGDRFPAQSPT
jgi:hypothetical protein